MCGIAGWVSAGTVMPSNALKRMLDAIAHRGPDGDGEYFGGGERVDVALGHRRLSIVGGASGAQPMGDDRGEVIVTFNGEIYNWCELALELAADGYPLRTSSDTEVIPYAYRKWGVDFVTHLRGMFAIALWDSKKQLLLLTRDRFGEKPLFLQNYKSALLFASEPKALIAATNRVPELNKEVVTTYLRYRYVPGPATLISGIEKLPPATTLVWQNGNKTTLKYYTLPDLLVPRRISRTPDVVGRFLAQLEEAVRVRLMSDVPFGAFLSGGIDSAMVVALMARNLKGSTMTFSVGFAEETFSELERARRTSEYLGTDHHEVIVTSHDVVAHLPMLVRFRDGPVVEPSDLALYRLSLAAAAKVKMVPTGEGADELLAGYPKYYAEKWSKPYQRLFHPWIRARLAMRLIEVIPYRYRRAKTVLATLGLENPEDRLARWFGAVSEVEASRLVLGASLPQQTKPNSSSTHWGLSYPGALRQHLAFDQMHWLPDNLLERGDRMTMAASLEARAPFLDHKLSEFISQLPDGMRLRGRTTKYILREASKRIFPSSFFPRRKIGLSSTR